MVGLPGAHIFDTLRLWWTRSLRPLTRDSFLPLVNLPGLRHCDAGASGSSTPHS